MTKKLIYIFLLSLCLIGCAASRYFPYLIKLNIHSGYLNLPTMEYGYEYQSVILSLIFLLSSLIVLAVTDNVIALLIPSLFNLGIVAITRFYIHDQDFDHHYDSKTGSGFHLLFAFSMLHFLLIAVKGMTVIWGNYREKQRRQNLKMRDSSN